MDIDQILRIMMEREASDLHLRVPSPPVLRIHGALTPLEGANSLTPQDTLAALERVTTEEQRQRFFGELELDFAYGLPGLARFRVNAFFQRGSVSLAFRLVPAKVKSIDELGLPSVCKALALKPRGLVLVAGPTGSGKSTTLAAMIDYLNEHDQRNIITIEDPIEFLHQNKKCIIAQRDLGGDTKSFATALRHALRQDPDVILVGEMRDLETISTAITAAETGHLVLSTLHTSSAAQTVDRIIDVFPPGQQDQVRTQLALIIEGVLSQLLLPRHDGKGRAAAFEVMVATTAIRNLIREAKTYQIPNMIQTGAQHGMQTMDQGLKAMVDKGLISADQALSQAQRPEELQRLLSAVAAEGWG